MKFAVGAAQVDLIDTDDRICISGPGWEAASRERWAALCADGGTVLDIGAYTGIYAIGAALLGCKARAFEPLEANVIRLSDNIRRNKVQGAVSLTPACVGDREGRGLLTYNQNVRLTSGASLMGLRGARQSVYVVTVDQFALDDIRAMKVDVERGERAVLAGAKETIARCKPAILIEILDPSEAESLLPAGYRLAERLDQRNYLMLPC